MNGIKKFKWFFVCDNHWGEPEKKKSRFGFQFVQFFVLLVIYLFHSDYHLCLCVTNDNKRIIIKTNVYAKHTHWTKKTAKTTASEAIITRKLNKLNE